MLQSAHTPITDYLEEPLLAVDVREPSTLLLRRLESDGQQTALIVDGGKPVGIVRLAAAREEAADDRLVGNLSVEPLPVVLQDTMTAQDIVNIPDAAGMDRLPVVNAAGMLIGEIVRSRLLAAGDLREGETATVVTETTLGEAVAVDVREGQSVVSSNGHRIGTVKSVIVEANSGRISHFILTEGTIFKHDRKVNVELIAPDTGDTDTLHLKVDKEDIDRLGDYGVDEPAR